MFRIRSNYYKLSTVLVNLQESTHEKEYEREFILTALLKLSWCENHLEMTLRNM